MDPRARPSHGSSLKESHLPSTSMTWPGWGLAAAAAEYLTDAAQRSILFWDTMRQRSNQYREHMSQTAPHVLDFDTELVMDGRTLERPVNYLLARIIPPPGLQLRTSARPFVVIDPRAGHGPGIGGFKADSEIGVALRAGNPCYFIGFLPEPVEGQTIPDIVRAQAIFIEHVGALHQNADGRPCVIGNCQAGWALAMTAAVSPALFGPLILAGSPLSYWNGVHGRNPMRYTGGLLGGSWLTALSSDLGAGKFDGATLVQNFENQNPANTLWTKQYNLYSEIDTESARYLSFERWWGGHVTLNPEEIQFIVDELFIGNKLAAGEIRMSDGTTVDLRNIRSPIVVFCSKADNITPPQQALGWILDLYDSVDDIRSFGQTIVYSVHEQVGHLGIFVSGSVATREYGEFSSNIDLIDTLPPGLYEAVFEHRPSDAGQTADRWIMRCEARSLEDIRAMGGNDQADDRRFATAAKLSEYNLAMYRTFAQPWIRTLTTPALASWLRAMHPLRLQYELLSDAHPFAASIKSLAEITREYRKPVTTENMFLKLQGRLSQQIEANLDDLRARLETLSEDIFLSVYSQPGLQSAMGIDPHGSAPPRHIAKNPLHRALQDLRQSDLRIRMAEGGIAEATIRGLLYAGLDRAAVDERGFEIIRKIRARHTQIPLAQFKVMVRDQFFMLLLDTDAAMTAIPSMLADEPEMRNQALAAIVEVLEASGPLSPDDQIRLERVRDLFGVRSVTGASRAKTISGS